MRTDVFGILAAIAIACLVVAAEGQVAESPLGVNDRTPAAKLSYTAEYRTTTEKTLANGSTVTSESKTVTAVDSKGRRVTMFTATAADGKETTQFGVSDPVNHTLRSWAVPGTTARVMNAPDVGEDTDCSRKMKAIGPLHPAGVNPPPPVKDLGTATIQGIETQGGEVSFSQAIFRLEDGPKVITNQVWTATEPALDELLVRMISVGGPAGKSTRELVRFTRGEPDPSLFEIPPGRTVTTRDGLEYSCNAKPATAPVTEHPAQ
jgi:hypothetical protein